MTVPTWQLVEAIGYDRYKIRHSRQEKKGRSASRTKLFLVIPAMILLSLVPLYPGSGHPARDSPAQISPTSQTLIGPVVVVTPEFTPIMPVGSLFTIQIQVNNMPDFNGWDIEISADPSVLTATSLSITGNDFAVNASSGTPFEIVHCVNGVGTGCTSSDGPGIVHSAYGNTATLTGNGLLFTVTYRVVGIGPASRLGLANDLVSSPSSGNGVPHGSVSGQYGDPQAFGGGKLALRA